NNRGQQDPNQQSRRAGSVEQPDREFESDNARQAGGRGRSSQSGDDSDSYVAAAEDAERQSSRQSGRSQDYDSSSDARDPGRKGNSGYQAGGRNSEDYDSDIARNAGGRNQQQNQGGGRNQQDDEQDSNR